MSKLPDYVSKTEMSTLVILGTVAQLMSNAASFYKNKDRSDWARKLKCASTYIDNVMVEREGLLGVEHKKAYKRRYKTINMYISCTDVERFSPDVQDDPIIKVSTQDAYDLAEFAIEQCKSCQKNEREIADCKYKAIMLRWCVPINDAVDTICPFGDSRQNVSGALDAERKFLKSKI